MNDGVDDDRLGGPFLGALQASGLFAGDSGGLDEQVVNVGDGGVGGGELAVGVAEVSQDLLLTFEGLGEAGDFLGGDGVVADRQQTLAGGDALLLAKDAQGVGAQVREEAERLKAEGCSRLSRCLRRGWPSVSFLAASALRGGSPFRGKSYRTSDNRVWSMESTTPMNRATPS